MIACIGLDMHEESTMDIQVMKVDEGKHGKLTIHLTNKEKTFSLSCRDKGEARRFAGYLQKRNPNIKLENIQPEGNGTLQDLGALIEKLWCIQFISVKRSENDEKLYHS